MQSVQTTISKATELNWTRLKVDVSTKLTKRANKSKSAKRVVATSYLSNSVANEILSRLSILPFAIGNIMYSLCIELLNRKGISEKQHVQDTLSNFRFQKVELNISDCLWEESDDILGFIYQSLVSEGDRNATGQYYTSKDVVKYMVQDVETGTDKTFFDPCCGSGAFLLGINAKDPTNLYGMDIDPIAVMLTSTNLLLKYPENEFIPNIYCSDFLDDSIFAHNIITEKSMKFDYIYTNPPWGTDKSRIYSCSPIISKEKSSMFLVKVMNTLAPKGHAHLLLPSSLLKIKVHSDVRSFILKNTTIKSLDLYSDRFAGVFTDYFSIRLTNERVESQIYQVTNNNDRFSVCIANKDYVKSDISFRRISVIDESIFAKMERKKHDDLTHSKWALGIVTGDNKRKLYKEHIFGTEAIFAGKQVEPYKMNEKTSYIVFSPSDFQQCAKEELYRAPEKLIYRFIAKYPIVAYDNQQRLCLNSANILIPEIEGASVRSVAALLNSSLYRFYYIMKFKDIKVLKGNLQTLPFPLLTDEQDNALSSMVTQFTNTIPAIQILTRLDEMIFSIFEITDIEKQHIYDIIK